MVAMNRCSLPDFDVCIMIAGKILVCGKLTLKYKEVTGHLVSNLPEMVQEKEVVFYL